MWANRCGARLESCCWRRSAPLAAATRAELPRPKGSGTPFDPMAAMAGVGLSYRMEDGQEWAGPGRVRIDRFGADGVIAGSFTGLRLPHTDRQLPDVTLTDGTFHARIGAAR